MQNDPSPWSPYIRVSLSTQERFGSNRLTALHLASDCGKKEAIALLLVHGADPTVKDKLKKV